MYIYLKSIVVVDIIILQATESFRQERCTPGWADPGNYSCANGVQESSRPRFQPLAVKIFRKPENQLLNRATLDIGSGSMCTTEISKCCTAELHLGGATWLPRCFFINASNDTTLGGGLIAT